MVRVAMCVALLVSGIGCADEPAKDRKKRADREPAAEQTPEPEKAPVPARSRSKDAKQLARALKGARVIGGESLEAFVTAHVATIEEATKPLDDFMRAPSEPNRKPRGAALERLRAACEAYVRKAPYFDAAVVPLGDPEVAILAHDYERALKSLYAASRAIAEESIVLTELRTPKPSARVTPGGHTRAWRWAIAQRDGRSSGYLVGLRILRGADGKPFWRKAVDPAAPNGFQWQLKVRYDRPKLLGLTEPVAWLASNLVVQHDLSQDMQRPLREAVERANRRHEEALLVRLHGRAQALRLAAKGVAPARKRAFEALAAVAAGGPLELPPGLKRERVDCMVLGDCRLGEPPHLSDLGKQPKDTPEPLPEKIELDIELEEPAIELVSARILLCGAGNGAMAAKDPDEAGAVAVMGGTVGVEPEGNGGLLIAGLDKEDGGRKGGRFGKVRFKEKKARAVVTTGRVSVSGGALTRAIIRKYINRQKGAIIYCYKRAVQKEPELAGKVVVSFTISPTGRVTRPGIKTSTLGNSTVESCIKKRLAFWRFPAPPNAGAVRVSFPLLFRTK